MKIDRKKVYEKFDGRCAYCGNAIEFKDMQVDHVVPKRLSYHFDYDNSIDNLMPSCRTCNHYKRCYLLANYRGMIKTLHKRLEKIYIFKVAIRYGIVSVKPFDGQFYFEKFIKQ